MGNENVEEPKEGWGFPGTSRKAHYFVDGMSLCRKWGFYQGPLEQGNDESPDNCSACVKALIKKRPTKLTPLGPDRGPQTTDEIKAMEKLQRGECLH